MRTVSIQTKAPADQDRIEIWRHAAGLLGVELDDDDLAFVAAHDDRAVVQRLFGSLSDAARHELLWATGSSPGFAPAS